MTASHSAVETGGKSFKSSSATSAFLYHLDQIAERDLIGGFGMDEEHGGAARALARGRIQHLEAGRLHIIEGLLNVRHAQCDVRKTPASAIFLELFRYRRFSRQRFEQLQ